MYSSGPSCCSRGENQVLGIHGLNDVNRRKGSSTGGLCINIDADDALLAAEERRCTAGNGRELGADEIVAVVESCVR